MNVGPYNFEPTTYFPEIDHLRAGGGQIGDSDDVRHVFFYGDDGKEPTGIELFGLREQLEAEGTIAVVLLRASVCVFLTRSDSYASH